MNCLLQLSPFHTKSAHMNQSLTTTIGVSYYCYISTRFSSLTLILASFISRSVDCFINAYGTDARAMWTTLKEAAAQATFCEQMDWLCQSILTRINGDEVESRIHTLATDADWINSFMKSEQPLMANEIRTTKLIILLPSNILSCFSSIIDTMDVASSSILLSLQEEWLCRQSSWKQSSTSPFNCYCFDADLFCFFCHFPGHNLTTCGSSSGTLSYIADDGDRGSQWSGNNAGENEHTGFLQQLFLTLMSYSPDSNTTGIQTHAERL
ncbi:hypothetical protein VP01_5547g1 [Puccinia sorghi]|uniref:Uncharacterized protein n=1 Tax=Puccinia sorghi TaxID=27349 RepID=A0A0L6UJ70_9BASI|nr:hypothetical protein VP01_5547g1 [Puccinia sorghi]